MIGLFIWIALCLAVGGTASYFTMASIPTWYASILKPSWTPPNQIFGPVWTLLYILMGVAGWRIWRKGGFNTNRHLLILFFIQLTFNFFWSFLFFKLQRPDVAFVDILFLGASILATIVAFARKDALSAWLLVPYFIWVMFASGLNFAIWRLNPI